MSELGYTQGTGSEIKTDQGSITGAHMQMVKLTEGITGSENLLPSSVANGMLVEVSRVDGTVAINGTVAADLQDSSGHPLTQTNPLFVELSDGANPLGTSGNPVRTNPTGATTQPVSLAGTPPVSVSGTLSLPTPAVPTVTPTGTAGAANYSYLIAARPGDGSHTPASAAGSTSTGNATLSNSNYNALSWAAIAGAATYDVYRTVGGGSAGKIANVLTNSYNDQGAAGDSSTAPTTNTTGLVTVAGTVTAQIKDGAGNLFSAANPLPTRPQPSSNFWKAHVTFSASLSDQAIFTPPSGKTIFIEGLIITPTAAGALLKIYDQTNADANAIYVGQPPLGSIVITPARPIPLSAINNILRWATGASAAGDITAWGYTA